MSATGTSVGVMTEWVSARGAAEILARDGLSRTTSRRVLAAGLAGEPLRTSAATLYDAGRVRSLLDRPVVELDVLPILGDRAVLEIRVAPGSDPDDRVRIGNAGALVRVHLRLLAAHHGFLPTLYTCCGFVLEGAEVTDAFGLSHHQTHLQVRPPGAWFASFSGTRLRSGPGNAWRLWTRPPRAGQSLARIAS